MDQIPQDRCCPDPVHAQIEYTNPNGMSVETLISTADPKFEKNRKFLHAMLDEWIDRRVEGKHADHFIVYGKWPGEDPLA